MPTSKQRPQSKRGAAVPADAAFDDTKKSLAQRLATQTPPSVTSNKKNPLNAEAPEGQTVPTVETPGDAAVVAEVPAEPPLTLAVTSPANEQWLVTAKNMGTDPELYLHHADLQAQRASVLHELNEAMAARQLTESKLGIEAERNIWLGKQLEEADKVLSQNQSERERIATHLLQWEEMSRQLSEENEQLKHKLDLSEKARKQKQLDEEHALCLENVAVKQHNSSLKAQLDEALRSLRELREANERGGKQLWDADTRVDALTHEKDMMLKDLEREREARQLVVSQLEAANMAKGQAVWDRDEMEMKLNPLQEANHEVCRALPSSGVPVQARGGL